MLCDLATIADGASSSVTITVKAVAEGDLVNSASVGSDLPDPDPSDDAAAVTVLVGPTSDLSIVKTGPATVAAGGQLTYTLMARNDGPSAATGVSVTDQLPAGMTYVGSVASQGSCAVAGGIVTCAFGGLANGANATATVTAQATFALAGQTVPNTAAIAGDQNDGDPGDDVSTHNVTVGPAADLVFSKDAPAHVPAGGRLLYSLQVTNDGPQTAAAVEITDDLPAGVTFVSAGPTQGSCAATGQTVTCQLGDLPAGAGAQVLLTADVAPGLAGTSVAQRRRGRLHHARREPALQRRRRDHRRRRSARRRRRRPHRCQDRGCRAASAARTGRRVHDPRRQRILRHRARRRRDRPAVRGRDRRLHPARARHLRRPALRARRHRPR